MSSDLTPLSEGRPVPSSSTTDARHRLRSPGLDAFRVNPFRTLRLPVRVPSQDAVWKAEKVLSRLRAGVDLPEPDYLAWLPPADEFDVREGAQKMEEPLRRLREQLLWFDVAGDPHGKALESALVDQNAAALSRWLQTPEADVPQEPVPRVAHRLNQANARLVVALATLHGMGPFAATAAAAPTSPPHLAWKNGAGAASAVDVHAALAPRTATVPPWAAPLEGALSRWATLVKDPALTAYVADAIAALGDDLVGEDDIESIVGGLTIAIADMVVGEMRHQLSTGRIDSALELAKIATHCGIDPTYWTTAFRPLRALFQAEVTDLETLLDGTPHVKKVVAYLGRLRSATAAWATVDDQGTLGLDQIVDAAVMRAVDALRMIEHPGVVLDPILAACDDAKAIARSTSVRERITEYKSMLHKFRDVMCHYCQKRGARMETSVVVQGRKVISREHVGFNTIRTTYSISAGLVGRCGTCAELHQWVHDLAVAMWVAPLIGAVILLAVLAPRASGPVPLGFAVLVLFLVAYLARQLVVKLVTPKGEGPVWTHRSSQGYRRLVGEGYSISKHDYRKNAYARLRGGVT